ncbi:MAG: hypothetical protein ACXWPK_17450 [Isosphaeraceae bacterium]
MIINIELRPEEELALLERAQTSGRDLASYVHQILREHIHAPDPDIGRDKADDEASFTVEDLIDHEAIASCTKEADDSITLEAVRAGTSTIKDSMARVVIEEERAERF